MAHEPGHGRRERKNRMKREEGMTQRAIEERERQGNSYTIDGGPVAFKGALLSHQGERD